MNSILKFSINILIMISILFICNGCGQGKKFVIFSIIQETTKTSEDTKIVENVIANDKIEVITYLGLFGGEDHIIPSNIYTQWSGYPLIFEKREGKYYELKVQSGIGNLPTRAVWLHTEHVINVYDGTLKNWIYLCSESHLEYDVSEINDGKFSGYVGLANPWYLKKVAACGHNGSVQIKFQINGSTIYDTKRITGIEQQEPIYVEFDIPKTAKTLTIKVFDGGDNIDCDHWTMGDAKIRHIQRSDQ